MKAHTLVIGTIIALWTAPLGAAAPAGTLPNEEARLMARLNWQRARIEQLRAQIRTLAPAATTATVAGDEALRPGLTAEELRAARGEPDHISPLSAHCELWIYGSTRVTLLGGRVTSWQTAAQPVAPVSAPSAAAAAAHTLDDEMRPAARPSR